METLQRTANRGSVSTGFDISNSLKLEPDNTEYLHYTPASQTDYERMTFSIWIQRTELEAINTLAEFGNGTANTTQLRILFDSDDKLAIYGNSIVWRLTDRIFRDMSSWYHLFFKFDTTQGTSNDRIRVWVNGEMIPHSEYSTVNNPGSGTAMGFNRTSQQSLGTQDEDGPKNYFSGYISQAWGSGGTPPDVTDFGEFDEDSGIWKPKDISEVSVPDANGFFLDFSDSSDLGNDSSSNNNDFTLNNITAVDQSTNVPTNSFNVINPNQGYYFQGNTYYAYTEGATRQQNTISNVAGAAQSLAVNKGKWYCEWKYTAGTNQQIFVGILAQDATASAVKTNAYSNCTTCTWYPKQQLTYYKNNGTLVTASATRNSGISAGDVIGMFLDMDNNHLYFQKNGSDINVGEVDASTLLFSESNLFDCDDQFVCFYANTYDSSNQITWNWGGINLTGETTSYSDANGHGSFKYNPVRGSDNYYALCTKNLVRIG